MRRAATRRLAWLALTVGMVAAPTALLAAPDDCGYARTTAAYIFARADAAWVGKLERVLQTRQSGDGFVVTRSGYYWMKPLTALKGPLPRASLRRRWEAIWEDAGGETGGPPDADEPYVVAVYKHGQDIGDFTLYRAACVADLETAPRPTGPQPKGYELVVQARQARLAGEPERALGLIRRARDELDALGDGQPKAEGALRRADYYLERYLIEKARWDVKPCDGGLLFAEVELRRGAPDNPRATELRKQINAHMTAGACKPLGSQG